MQVRFNVTATVVTVVLIAAGIVFMQARRGAWATPPPQPPVVKEPDAASSAMDTVVSGSNKFAFDLYGRLRGQPGNAFFSPFSITTGLGMTYEGARGQTATEQERVFGFPADTQQRHDAFAALQHALNPENAPYQLSVANALWAQQNYRFRPEYTAALKRYYASAAVNLDIAGAPEQARVQINDWVAGKTHDKIKDLFAPGALSDATRLVLTNAVYFKGRWEDEFDKADTRDEDFRAPGGTRKVPMMRRTDHDARFRYLENGELQAIELPYKGEQLSMLVLLPKGDDLKPLEARLTAQLLSDLRAKLAVQQVHLYLPRFTFDSSYSLSDTLAAMGMPSAFVYNTADFSGMDGTRDLYISLVVHKAFVDVNEEGTEAAAATGVAMTAGAVYNPAPIPEFRADHPFLFYIVHKPTGAVLFMGRVEDPGK